VFCGDGKTFRGVLRQLLIIIIIIFVAYIGEWIMFTSLMVTWLLNENVH